MPERAGFVAGPLVQPVPLACLLIAIPDPVDVPNRPVKSP